MTKIEWTNETWNPVTGCDKVSQGCKNCYAEVMHRRLQGMFPDKYSQPFLGHVQTHSEDLFTPFNWHKPRMIFVNSMSDLFHDDVPDSFIDRVFAIMALCPQHTFQILTKRTNRMLLYFTRYSEKTLISRWADACQDMGIQDINDRDLHLQAILKSSVPLKNVWLGTSCEDQKAADERIPVLKQVPAVVRFLSCEPLIGPIDIAKAAHVDVRHGRACQGFSHFVDNQIHWVIAGGESGYKARPMRGDWARALRDQCQAVGSAFFFKQWGRYIHYENVDDGLWQSAQTMALFNKERIDEMGSSIRTIDRELFRVYNKSMNHNSIDGVQHLEFPKQLNQPVI